MLRHRSGVASVLYAWVAVGSPAPCERRVRPCGLRLASGMVPGVRPRAQFQPLRKLLRRQYRFDPGDEILPYLPVLRAPLLQRQPRLRSQAL